jgi:hypothetical protein
LQALATTRLMYPPIFETIKQNLTLNRMKVVYKRFKMNSKTLFLFTIMAGCLFGIFSLFMRISAKPDNSFEGQRGELNNVNGYLVNSNPRQSLSPLRQLVATSCQLLLGFEQLEPSRKPLFTGSDPVVIHCLSPTGRRKEVFGNIYF